MPKMKAAMRLAQEIVATIYESKMQPGDRYLSEADALQHHRVARGTYREALRFLEIQGVVNIRAGPGGGPEIRRPGWPQLASTIALLLQFADAPMREVLEARTAIEPGVARMAAMYATAQDIEAMADDLDEIEAQIGNFKKFSPAYLQFWNHLAESTHNAFLMFVSPALRAIVNSAGFVPERAVPGRDTRPTPRHPCRGGEARRRRGRGGDDRARARVLRSTEHRVPPADGTGGRVV